MKRELYNKLQSSYISVTEEQTFAPAYGGSQNFFAVSNLDAEKKENEKKQKMGCGIVALGDLFLYLGIKEKGRFSISGKSYVNCNLNKQEYMEFFDLIYDFAGGISRRYGVSGIRLAWAFNRMARRQGWKERAVWGIGRTRLLLRIRQMLQKDLPVILCVPMMLCKKHKRDGLWFYENRDGEFVPAEFVTAHYVVVTEVFYANEPYLTVSSWGRKYFIRWQEYEKLIRTHLLGTILGNILYIR